MSVYLGEKVVSENEYLSAMAMCDKVLEEEKEIEVMWRGQAVYGGCEMDAGLELVKAPGNRWTRRRKP